MHHLQICMCIIWAYFHITISNSMMKGGRLKSEGQVEQASEGG